MYICSLVWQLAHESLVGNRNIDCITHVNIGIKYNLNIF